MRRRAFLASAPLVAVAGCIGIGAEERYVCGPDCDVGMSSHAFAPVELTIDRGTTVTWKNTSSRGHTVTAYDGGLPEGAAYFASGDYPNQAAAVEAWYDHFGGRMEPGDTFSHTFEVAGTHEYYCVPHEAGGMIGSVVVRE